MTSLILSPALSMLARATGKVAGRAMRRTLTLVSMFFEAIVEARSMMARRQAIRSAAGVAANERRHDSRPERAVHEFGSAVSARRREEKPVPKAA